MRKLLPTLLAAVALSFGSGAANASTVISFDLTGGNNAISPYTGPYGTVTVTWLSSTTATIQFDSNLSGPNPFVFGDGGSVAVNVNASSFTLGTITGSNTADPSNGFTPGPYSDGGSGNEDGWGLFNQTINSFDGYTHSSTTITFGLTNNTGTWADAESVLLANSLGHLAAAHIFVCAATDATNAGTCDPAVDAVKTGFAAGDGPDMPTPTPPPNDNPPVPEPSTLLLLGSGLLVAARRLRKVKK